MKKRLREEPAKCEIEIFFSMRRHWQKNLLESAPCVQAAVDSISQILSDMKAQPELLLSQSICTELTTRNWHPRMLWALATLQRSRWVNRAANFLLEQGSIGKGLGKGLGKGPTNHGSFVADLRERKLEHPAGNHQEGNGIEELQHSKWNVGLPSLGLSPVKKWCFNMFHPQKLEIHMVQLVFSDVTMM